MYILRNTQQRYISFQIPLNKSETQAFWASSFFRPHHRPKPQIFSGVLKLKKQLCHAICLFYLWVISTFVLWCDVEKMLRSFDFIIGLTCPFRKQRRQLTKTPEIRNKWKTIELIMNAPWKEENIVETMSYKYSKDDPPAGRMGRRRKLIPRIGIKNIAALIKYRYSSYLFWDFSTIVYSQMSQIF